MGSGPQYPVYSFSSILVFFHLKYSFLVNGGWGGLTRRDLVDNNRLEQTGRAEGLGRICDKCGGSHRSEGISQGIFWQTEHGVHGYSN